MNTKRPLIQSLACALVGLSLSAAHAESPASADSVADSFQRMLDHTPTQTVPLIPDGTDPLRGAICALLWNAESLSFHLPDNVIRVAALNQAGR